MFENFIPEDKWAIIRAPRKYGRQQRINALASVAQGINLINPSEPTRFRMTQILSWGESEAGRDPELDQDDVWDVMDALSRYIKAAKEDPSLPYLLTYPDTADELDPKLKANYTTMPISQNIPELEHQLLGMKQRGRPQTDSTLPVKTQGRPPTDSIVHRQRAAPSSAPHVCRPYGAQHACPTCGATQGFESKGLGMTSDLIAGNGRRAGDNIPNPTSVANPPTFGKLKPCPPRIFASEDDAKVEVKSEHEQGDAVATAEAIPPGEPAGEPQGDEEDGTLADMEAKLATATTKRKAEGKKTAKAKAEAKAKGTAGAAAKAKGKAAAEPKAKGEAGAAAKAGAADGSEATVVMKRPAALKRPAADITTLPPKIRAINLDDYFETLKGRLDEDGMTRKKFTNAASDAGLRKAKATGCKHEHVREFCRIQLARASKLFDDHFGR